MPTPRYFVSSLLVLTGCLAIPFVKAAAAQGTRSKNSVPVQDPTLGLVQGDLPISPGWRGEAHIDRTSDPLAYAMGTLTADLRSPDGTATIQMLPVQFHTYNVSPQLGSMMPGNPARQRNAALVRFSSTADLLKLHILPALGLNGHPEMAISSTSEEAKARMRSQAQVPGPIYDSALAIMRGPKGGELIVFAVTTGSQVGTPRENTSTTILVCTAPDGKAMPTFIAQEALPPVQRSGAWVQADEQYLAEWRRARQEESARSTREFQRGNEAILAQGHANIAAMQARGEERDRAFIEHEQRTSDLGANFRGYLSGTGATFKWCGAGGPTYTVDDVRPPAPGLHRCD